VSELLIHLHVPKCSGTSINRVLQKKFQGAIVDNQTPAMVAKLNAMTEAERDSKYQVVLGHWQWGVHRYFSKPATYFTVFRPPVSRICSFFNYVHTNPEHDQHLAIKKILPDLNKLTDDIMSRPFFRANWSNYYCFAYSGRRPVDEASFIALQTQVLDQIRRGRLLIGSTARIAAFLRERGILEGDLPRANETQFRADDTSFVPARVEALSPQVLARLQRWNRYDIRLISAIAERQPLA
jgi:hypothetical protein